MRYADVVNLKSYAPARHLKLAVLLGLPGSWAWAGADAETINKSQYHLFRPTPREHLRAMSTDRPDQTESAYTVDAGHFQVEMDAVSAVFDRDRSSGGDVQTTGWGTSLNLKAGLLNNVDLQFILDPYATMKVKDHTTGAEATASGLGEFQTRLKVNLWGNDGGKTAVAIMPFVKWPLPESSLRNGDTEGGIIVPWAVELPAGWGLGGITEFDFVSGGSGNRDTEYFNTIALSRDLWGKLGGYVELAALVSPAGEGGWLGQVDVGFTYAVNEDVQFDFGCNFGVTKSAPDFNPFIGLSWRL
jgi:Putative MetA-pathway of phenol degradation